MRIPKPGSHLVYPATALSLGSLAWTTWSLVDLLGAGAIGLTVAAGADIIWASVIAAEARGIRIAGRRWPVIAVGWAALAAVAAFLVWHGLTAGSAAMAAAGPFLPLGAKIVWALALADMRDPAALTDDERRTLADLQRRMTFEEAQHRITMRRREMHAEQQLTEVSTDFDIELMRQDKTRELHRRRPLHLEAPHRGAPASSTAAPLDPGAAAAAPTAPEPPAAPHDAPRCAAPPPPLPIPDEQHAPATDPLSDLTGLTKADAVLRIKAQHPDASAPELVRRLAEHGISAQPGYVRTVLGRARKAREREQGQGFYP